MQRNNAVLMIRINENFMTGFAVTAIVGIFAGYILGAFAAMLSVVCKVIYERRTEGESEPVLSGCLAALLGIVMAIGLSVTVSFLFKALI